VSGDRFPVGARFSAPVQTGLGAYRASYTMGTEYFPGERGCKSTRAGVDHPPHLDERKSRAIPLLLPLGVSRPFIE